MATSVSEIPLLPEEQLQRQRARENSSLPQIWALLDQVKDPEIPVLSIWDLGVLRDVYSQGDELVVAITPTYSGCPAMETIKDDIVAVLLQAGLEKVKVITQLAPAWSSHWMTPHGRSQIQQYGIAPPSDKNGLNQPASCPNCGSSKLERVSEFGSTACKALYRCTSCLEPFDYFKSI